MNKIVHLLVFLFIIDSHFDGFGQDRIPYILPDAVEECIAKYVSSYHNTKDNCFYFCLSREGSVFTIYGHHASCSDDWTCSWERLTNRFLLVKDTYYPLTFDYDEMFSTPDTISVGVFGERNGNIKRRLVIHEGFYVKFKGWELIETNLPSCP
ncbi:MAG: hypothetical protein ILA23_01660 [Bacteroidales bacterium]|nr:hypothetical protein [Bacteroidales bacterium]MBR1501993.1 hypothetical protein [Bacteroidales bacterium]